MESFLQIAEICLDGLVSPAELQCFTRHLNVLEKMSAEEIPKDQLKHIRQQIKQWRSEFVSLYQGQEEKVRGKGTSIPSSSIQCGTHAGS